MKRLINNGDIFDKYANLEEKSLKDHPEEKRGNFDWYGHRHISGTYSGAAYSTSLADGYMATDLRSDSNPRGSILKAAKNYTDEKVATAGKTLYAHYITLRNGNTNLIFSYISSKAEEYTVATLKADLKTTKTGTLKKIACNGYSNSKPTQYITVDKDSFVVAVLDNNGAITKNITAFNDIQDYVEAI